MRASWSRGVVVAVLTLCLSLGAASTAGASGRDRDRCPGQGVPTKQISIQLWTFAEYIGFGTDAATIERTRTVFEALRRIGYRNVEPFTLSGLTAEQYRDLLREYGLRASSRHVDVGTPAAPANIDQIIADNRTLGIRYFGSGGTPRLTTEAEWIAYARYLNELGARARAAGQQLMVHNHNWEFETRFGDRTAFDILMQYTDRRNVAFQLDLYWAVRGGADPIQLIRRYGDRIQLFHVKDMAAPKPTGRIEIVGRGVIDFPKIFAAAGKDIRYYVVEHDPRFGDPTFDPFVAAREGFRYLSCVKFKHGKGHGGGHHDRDRDKDKDKDKGKHGDDGHGDGQHGGGSPNQGNADKVLTVNNASVSCQNAKPGRKIEGGLGRVLNLKSDHAIDYVTIKSGNGATVSSAEFGDKWAKITLSKDVSNYVVWTCEQPVMDT